MRTMLDQIDERTRAYEKLPLFRLLQDDGKTARERLAFVPALSHFVMTFADLYAHVLRDEPAKDWYQELVNAHTHEDGGHWKWFLADLVALDEDPALRVTETLRQLWGPQTIKTRLLSYRICQLGLGATSLQKLALVHCIEAAGKVSLQSAAPVGRDLGKQLAKPLIYFGSHHLETESGHTLEEGEVRRKLEAVTLDAATRAQLRGVVDAAFDAFTDFSDELAKYCDRA